MKRERVCVIVGSGKELTPILPGPFEDEKFYFAYYPERGADECIVSDAYDTEEAAHAASISTMAQLEAFVKQFRQPN